MSPAGKKPYPDRTSSDGVVVACATMQRDDRVGSQASRVTDGPFGIKIKDHPNGTVVTAVRTLRIRRANPGRFRG